MLTYLIKIYYTLEIVTPSSPSRAISSKMFPGMFSGNSIFKIQNLSVVVVHSQSTSVVCLTKRDNAAIF
jgi:hypothetical protein